MKIYLVGGAVRDELLGLPAKEKDWVVVGSTPDEMKTKGFKQVGKDFPVFIHPKTGEEYALARTERKSGHGYTGFEFDTNPNVTLEEDLARRDLTINAIAQGEDGVLIDPFDRQEDIKNKCLRHVSDAFSEDPLRVLRVARFETNLKLFTVHEDTMEIVQEIVESGELEYLTPERIWLEFYKSNHIYRFCKFLDKINILDKLLPGCVPFSQFEPDEFNDGSKLKNISYFMHENVGDMDIFCENLKVPNEYRDLAVMLNNCKEEYILFNPSNTDACDKLQSLIKKLDIRKEDRLKEFLEICNSFENNHLNYFLGDLIKEIRSYKLKKEDQIKPDNEIQKIVENDYKVLIQSYLNNYLKKSN